MQEAASDIPLWIQSFRYLTGFLITMLTLGVMAMITAGIGHFFIRQSAREAANSPVPAPQPQPTVEPAEPDGLATPLVAAIAAAVYHAVEEPHKIVSIKPAMSGWSQEGRRQIFGGRQVR